jgi:hypothetical protein
MQRRKILKRKSNRLKKTSSGMTNEDLKQIIKNAKLDIELEKAEVIYQTITTNKKGREDFYRSQGIGYILDKTPVMNWSDRKALSMMEPLRLENTTRYAMRNVFISRIVMVICLLGFMATL